MVITHVNTILKIELAEYCQAFHWLLVGIKERHGFGWSPCHFVHHSCDHFSVREKCLQKTDNKLVCVSIYMRKFCSVWGGTPFNTAAAERDSWNLLPRICIPPSRCRGCWGAVAVSKSQITLEDTQRKGLLEDWVIAGEEWRSAQSLQRKVMPCNFPHHHEKLFIPKTTRKKVGTFGPRFNKLGQDVKENLKPRTLRPNGWNWSSKFRRGEGLEKSPYPWAVQSP